MKKFYETPAVELTGFSVEDVITTSVVTIDTAKDTFSADDFKDAVANAYNVNVNNVNAQQYNSYTW